jgi:predicted nucleotidyltransferase
MDLKRFLEDLFEREIDLGTEESLKSGLKDNVMEDIKYAKTA